MSIEEKAKAYDEALERARKYMAKGYDVLMPEIFPELRESEDERIRKALIDGVSQIRCKGDVTREQMIAYLERQKYDRMKPIYDARESFESALEKAWNDYHNGYENVDKLEDDYVECAHAKGFREGYLFGLEKQKEQSLRDFIDDFPYSDQKEQKYIPKFKVGDKLVSIKNPHLTYEILEVGHVNELGNIEYKVEIFTDGKSDNPSNVKYMECGKVDEWGKLIEQKSIEDVIKNITKDKEAAIKFLKSAGIMNDNGELAEMYRSEQEPLDHYSVRDEFDLNGNLKQKLVERNEEDEEMIEHIVGSLDSLKHYVQDNNGFSENIKESVLKRIEREQDWLKSRSSWKPSEVCYGAKGDLDPAGVWKPSEHQMNILKAVKEYVGRGSGYWGEGLGSLIEDLEKL